MTKTMTEGNPLRLIIEFAIPLLLGNLLQQTYNIVDAAIVGKVLGTQALASVGATSSVQFLVIGFLVGTTCGFGIPLAKTFGAQDEKRLRNQIFHALLLSCVIALVLTVLCTCFCPKILSLLSTPKDIYTGAYGYLIVLFLGIPFTLLYNLLSAILRAVGDSKTPFLFLAFATVLNILLDLLYIKVFQWGCVGAAVATITAQAVSGILCACVIVWRYPQLCPHREDCRWKSTELWNMVVMGIPMGLQYSITAVGSMVMQSANNGLGSIYVSGFTVAVRLKQFFMCPFDAIATAVSVFCGQNLGAGNQKRIREGLQRGILTGVVYGLCAGAILICAGRGMSSFFVPVGEREVLNASAKYLFCQGCFFWVLGILNVCRMTTQGLGYAGRAVFSGVMEMIARISVSTLAVPVFGFTAICFTDQSAWISACIYIVPTCLLCLSRIKSIRNSNISHTHVGDV